VAIGWAWMGRLWQHRQTTRPTTFGSSHWATWPAVQRSGLLRPQGVMLGRLHGHYLRHAGPEHILVFAPTRSGKGVGLVVPTLLTDTGSVLVHDIKGENWDLTAGWRQQFSHVIYFNPTSPQSARYNPLLEVRKGDNEVRDAQNIADILVDPEGSYDRRDHWAKTGHALLVGAILPCVVCRAGEDPGRGRRVSGGPQAPVHGDPAGDDAHPAPWGRRPPGGRVRGPGIVEQITQ